jgi:hypothetical protein
MDEREQQDGLPGLGYRVVAQSDNVVLYRRVIGP